jgi:hypothetical protein
MFQYASPHAANPVGYAPPPGYVPPGYAPARVGAMVPFHDIVGANGYRAYDIVGQDTADKSTWQKVKDWGNKTTFGVKNKYLVGGAVVIGVAWYGYYAGWFGR